MLSSRRAAASGLTIFSRACSTTASSSCPKRSTATTASLIVAQLLYLEAQDPDKDIQFYINSPGRLRHRRHGHLRHHAVYQVRRVHHLRGHGGLDGRVFAVLRHEGQAPRAAERGDHDPSAVRRDAGPGHRHGHPPEAVGGHQKALERHSGGATPGGAVEEITARRASATTS